MENNSCSELIEIALNCLAAGSELSTWLSKQDLPLAASKDILQIEQILTYFKANYKVTAYIIGKETMTGDVGRYIVYGNAQRIPHSIGFDAIPLYGDATLVNFQQ